MNDLRIDYSSKEKYIESKKKIIEFIRNSIHLDEKREYLKGINCYSFALGFHFDIESFNKNWRFLTPGDIGNFISNNMSRINDDNFEDKLRYDMDTLGIELKRANESDESLCNLDSTNHLSWLIAAYLGKNENGEIEDCHFLRKLPNGLWVHKFGFKTEDILYSLQLNKYLMSPNELTYSQKGIYQLRMKR